MWHRGLSGQPCGTDEEATDTEATDTEATDEETTDEDRHDICQFFLHKHIFQNFENLPMKRGVNSDMLNLKYYISDVFIHLIGILS